MIFRRIFQIVFHPVVLPIYPVIALIFIYREVFIYRTAIFTHDTINWYANFNYFVSTLVQGSLPLWDPYAFGGAPFYLNHNIVGALDPTVLIAIPLLWFWDISILDIYNIHSLARLLIFYLGAYALFRYISRNYWASLVSSIFVMYTIVPNAFWQHGSALMVTYVPLIVMFLLQLISPETSKKSKGLIFIALCYLTGISFNIYLPSYLMMYLSFIVIYFLATRSIRLKSIQETIISVGKLKLLAGVLIFFIIAGPFIYSMFEMLPKISENFSLTRFDMPGGINNVDMTVHSSKINLTLSELDLGHSSVYNLLSFLLPGTDKGFFLADRPPYYTENFIPFSVIFLMIICLFFKQVDSPYKGLFLFLLVIIGLYWISPASLYRYALQYFPGAKTIRQLHNFFGFFILSFSALAAICMAEALKIKDNYKDKNVLLSAAVAVVILLYVGAMYYYLAHLRNMEGGALPSPTYQLALQDNIAYSGWQVVTASSLMILYFFIRPNLRIYPAIVIAGIIMYGLVDFNRNLRTYTVQPSNTKSIDYIHHNREFKYNEIRVPFTPRHTVFWGYLPALYRIPTAIPTYFNTYMSITRRAYDFIRFTPAERNKIISGIGSRRFGFFDKYIMAKNSRDALNLVAGIPKENLHDILVLEEKAVQTVSELKVLERVNRDTVPDLQSLSQIRQTMLAGRGQYLADFYDRKEYVNYEKYPNTNDGFLHIPLSANHPALDWPWDREHIGYYQILFGYNYSPEYFIIHKYHPNPPIRTDFEDGKICYTDVIEWQVKHVMPGFYEQIYNKYPYQCDLQKVDNKLIISPELQGAFVTDDIGGPEKDNIIPGFTVVSLDPAKVSPNRSPYGRDEPTEVIAFGPNMISFRVQNSKPGLFYYADSYSKDWKATISGVPTPVFKANFNYKAVFVPAGEQIITFSFYPHLYSILFKIFIVVSILLMPVPVIALWNLKRGNTEKGTHY